MLPAGVDYYESPSVMVGSSGVYNQRPNEPAAIVSPSNDRAFIPQPGRQQMTTGGYAGIPGQNTMGGTPAGTQGQGLDTSTLPPLPGEQGQLPQPEQPPMPEMPDWNAIQKQWTSAIEDAMKSNMALVASSLNNALQQLDQLQAQIMAQYQQMGQGIDPATQAALQNLREEINQRRQNLMEEMNRRGLLQSGVWLEMENRILKGQMTQEEQLIASRLADVQNRMTDALMQFASQRMNLMGQAAQNQMSIGQWASQAQLNAMQTLQSRQDEWNRWWQGIQEQRRQQAQEQARWQYEQQFNRAKQIADWMGTIPQGFPGAGQQTWQARMDLANLNKPSGGGSLATQYKMAKDAADEAWNRAIDNYVATNFPKFRTKVDLVAQLYRNYPNIVSQYGIDGFQAIMDEAKQLPDEWMGQGWLATRR
ncbi:hypothetical protein ACP3TJ_10350 [Desulforudis sp. 1088]|uniref:hypothetical protein n=1 Tax=unclassified Candidatus Desulforudis TaxID=2635950 RepID=UPI003CE4621C